MLKHHEESIRNLVSYYKEEEGVIAVILDGSIVHGRSLAEIAARDTFIGAVCG